MHTYQIVKLTALTPWNTRIAASVGINMVKGTNMGYGKEDINLGLNACQKLRYSMSRGI